MEATGAGQAPRSRLRVRATELATIASASFLLVTALLPSAAAYRLGLLATFGLTLAYAVIWYHVLPPGALGPWRYDVAGSIVQVILVYLLLVTGGAASLWFVFYLLPVLATAFSYRPRATASVAVVGAIGLLVVGAVDPAADSDATTLDALVVRILEFGAVASLAYVLTRTMASHRLGLQLREDRLREALTATEREAMTDALTGVHNRRSLDQVLGAVTSRAERDERPYALLLIDVDALKALNDRQGHAAGDQALRLIARAATDVVRSYDVVARFGGDEFVVVLHDTTAETAERTAERVQQRLAELFRAEPALARTTISIGTATWRPGRTPSELLAEADAEMYGMKRDRGRDATGRLKSRGEVPG